MSSQTRWTSHRQWGAILMFAGVILLLVAPLAISPAMAQSDTADVSFWESIHDSGDRDEFKAYLEAFPDGSFAPLAKIRIKKLTAESMQEDERRLDDNETTDQPTGRASRMIRKMDSDGDGRVASSEYRGQRPFIFFDKNADGFAGFEEIEIALGELPANRQGRESDRGQRGEAPSPDELLQRMDDDGDGRISAAEHRGRRPFKFFDKNDDGFATGDEIETALSEAAQRRAAGQSQNADGPARRRPRSSPLTNFEFSNFEPLIGITRGSGAGALIVMAHGDVSSGGPGDRLYRHAEVVARTFPNATVVAVLRPGYEDQEGQRSPGTNHGRKDQYTRENNDLLAQTIRNLKVERDAETVVVVGFSGGAAQTGTIIGRYPGLIDIAILVGCPCDIPALDRHRKHAPRVRSESPHNFVDQVPAETEVILLTGSKDKPTPPFLAVRHAERLGPRANVRIIEGASHKFSQMLPSVIEELHNLGI